MCKLCLCITYGSKTGTLNGSKKGKVPETLTKERRTLREGDLQVYRWWKENPSRVEFTTEVSVPRGLVGVGTGRSNRFIREGVSYTNILVNFNRIKIFALR